MRSAAETEVSEMSKVLSKCRLSGKNGASTTPGALTKLCTALNKLTGEGSAIAASNRPASLVSSMHHRFYTAGFHAAGLPQGILRASVIALHKRGEMRSKEGISANERTEAGGAGVARKGGKGSRGMGKGGGKAGGLGRDNEIEEKEEDGQAEEKDGGKGGGKGGVARFFTTH